MNSFLMQMNEPKNEGRSKTRASWQDELKNEILRREHETMSLLKHQFVSSKEMYGNKRSTHPLRHSLFIDRKSVV